MLIKGQINITDNFAFIQEALCMPQTTIISLDETGSLPEHQSIISGLELLPPVDALIAEADGEKMLFDKLYLDHFNTPNVDQFIGTIIVLLMSGRNIILYTPSTEIDQFSASKLIEMCYKLYGVGIGTIGVSNCYFDESCTPIWLGYAYKLKVITAKDYLTHYPENIMIPPNIMSELIFDISPFTGDNDYNNKCNYIYSLVHLYKETPELIIPIGQYNGYNGGI